MVFSNDFNSSFLYLSTFVFETTFSCFVSVSVCVISLDFDSMRSMLFYLLARSCTDFLVSTLDSRVLLLDCKELELFLERSFTLLCNELLLDKSLSLTILVEFFLESSLDLITSNDLFDL